MLFVLAPQYVDTKNCQQIHFQCAPLALCGLRGTNYMAWDDERVELLKKLWAEGLSASQIASKMGGVTRNAVIGKVHRLGLSGRATPAKPKRGCSTSNISASAAVTKSTPTPTTTSLPSAPEPEFTAPIILDTGDLTTVATLQRNMCKWPVGDPATDDFHFCGQSTQPGKSYCAYHAHMAFQPPQRRSAEPIRHPKAIAKQKRSATG